MNHDKTTEEFFRLRGWERIDDFWYNPEDIDDRAPGFGQEIYENLPNICESMTDWIKYVAEFMGGEGLKPAIGEQSQTSKGTYTVFHWTRYYPTEIKDHQILYASVLAANEYLRSKRDDI